MGSEAVAAADGAASAGSPAWSDDVDLHPDDVGKRIYSDEAGRTFILDDPLPVRSQRALLLPMCARTGKSSLFVH